MKKIPRNITLGVAPGWLFCGTVTEESETEIILSPAVYVENVTAAWTEAVFDRKKISAGHGVRDELRVQKHAILFEAACSPDVAALGPISALEKAR